MSEIEITCGNTAVPKLAGSSATRSNVHRLQRKLTVIHDEFAPVKVFGHVDRPGHALVPQVPHEELQPNECKDAKTEDGQNHYIRQLLHRLDQGAHDGLQACQLIHDENTHIPTRMCTNAQTWKQAASVQTHISTASSGVFVSWEYMNPSQLKNMVEINSRLSWSGAFVCLSLMFLNAKEAASKKYLKLTVGEPSIKYWVKEVFYPKWIRRGVGRLVCSVCECKNPSATEALTVLERNRRQRGEALLTCFSALAFGSALSYIYPIFSYERGLGFFLFWFFCNLYKANNATFI